MSAPAGYYPTGKGRTITVTLTANRVGRNGAERHSDPDAGGFSCGVTFSDLGLGGETQPTPGHFEYDQKITVNFTLTAPGGVNLSHSYSHTFLMSGYTVSGGSIDLDYSGSNALTGSINGVEYGKDSQRFEWGQIVTARTSGSSTVTATFHVPHLDPVTNTVVYTTYTETWSVSDTLSGSAADVGFYGSGWSLARSLGLGVSTLGGSISGAADMAGPGVEFGNQTFSLTSTDGLSTFSGSTASATFSAPAGIRGGVGGSCSGSTQWRVRGDLELVDCRDGSGVTGWKASLVLPFGTPTVAEVLQTVTAGATAGVQYPVDGSYVQNWTVSAFFMDGSTGSAGVSGDAFLVARNPITGHTGSLGVIVDEAWADANGVLLAGAGTPKYFGIYSLPPVNAGLLQVADSYTYGLFGPTPANWSAGPSTTVEVDGGYLHASSNGAFGTGVGMTTTLSFKPCPYRYYRVRVKTDQAGAVLKLTLSRVLAFGVAPGTTNHADYTYYVSLPAANVWTDVDLDLCFPNEFSDASYTTQPWYVVHPALFYESGGCYQVGISGGTGTCAFWFDSIKGWLKPESGGTAEDRLRTMLLAPFYSGGGFISGSQSQGFWGFARLNGIESLISSNPDTVTVETGSEYGRLYCNGAIGAELIPRVTAPSNHVQEAWTALQTSFAGTGVTVTPNVANLAMAALHGGYALNSGQGTRLARLNDTPGAPASVTAVAQPRLAAPQGYPGAGDPRDTTAGYSATIVMSGDKWINGEAQGLAFHQTITTSGVTGVQTQSVTLAQGALLSLRDNDSDTELNSCTVNRDGFWRMPARYGAQYPFSNLPKTSSLWSTRKQYTADGSGNVTSTTTQGLKMNSFWLMSDHFINRDGTNHMLTAAASVWRQPVSVRDRFPSYYDLPMDPAPAMGRGLWCLQTRRMQFHVAYGLSGDIKYRISPSTYAGDLGFEISVTGGTADSEPRMVDDWRDRLWLVFTRGNDTYVTYSDGDGSAGAWTTPTLMFSGGKHPDIAYDARSRTLWFGAYVSGQLQGSTMGPADASPSAAFTLSDETGAPLAPDDDSFHVAPAQDGSGRWQLTFLKAGAVVVYQSTDDGATWIQTV